MDYVAVATIHDEKIFEDWTQSIDVLVTFVRSNQPTNQLYHALQAAVFSVILIAFLIKASNQLERDTRYYQRNSDRHFEAASFIQ